MKKNIFLLLSFLPLLSYAQISYEPRSEGNFKKGDVESDYSFQATGRILATGGMLLDTAFEANYAASNTGFQFSEVRTRFNGNIGNPKISYLVELKWNATNTGGNLLNAISANVLDAAIRWQLNGDLQLIAGNYLMPGNRERAIYSQNTQFIDRSAATNLYSIGRDFGMQIRYQKSIGNIVIRPTIAVTNGEGLYFNNVANNSGLNYAGRLEIMPLGAFTNQGEYIQADLEREESLKIALGVSANYNDNTYLSGGQFGENLGAQRDLKFLGVDFIAKLNGLAVSGDYVYKTTDLPVIFTQDSAFSRVGSFLTGQAFSVQAGYLLQSNWEFAFRYAQTDPFEITNVLAQRTMTLGINKYIKGNQFKVQANLGAIQSIASGDFNYFGRIALDIAF